LPTTVKPPQSNTGGFSPAAALIGLASSPTMFREDAHPQNERRHRSRKHSCVAVPMTRANYPPKFTQTDFVRV
jgi:hypothetical protein